MNFFKIMSSIHLTNIEMEGIRLPELNSCKLFNPDFFFSEKEPTRLRIEEGRQEIKQKEEKRSISEDDDQEGEETAKQKEGIERENKGKKIEGSGEEGMSEIKIDLMETSQIQKKNFKKLKKNQGFLREKSDCYQIVESKKGLQKY